jgi:hypothetical protein
MIHTIEKARMLRRPTIMIYRISIFFVVREIDR